MGRRQHRGVLLLLLALFAACAALAQQQQQERDADDYDATVLATSCADEDAVLDAQAAELGLLREACNATCRDQTRRALLKIHDELAGETWRQRARVRVRRRRSPPVQPSAPFFTRPPTPRCAALRPSLVGRECCGACRARAPTCVPLRLGAARSPSESERQGSSIGSG